MSIESEITVGTIVVVKVGRNEVEVTVTEITANGWKVRSLSTGREFEVRHIERVVAEPAGEAGTGEPEAVAVAEPENGTAAPVEPKGEAEEAGPAEPEAAPEPASAPCPERKLSLLNAAAQVLAACRVPMNCKEMIAKAVEMGLWTPTGAKTPEQTLYSGIFREIKSGATPRFRKSGTRKGSFEYAGEQ